MHDWTFSGTADRAVGLMLIAVIVAMFFRLSTRPRGAAGRMVLQHTFDYCV